MSYDFIYSNISGDLYLDTYVRHLIVADLAHIWFHGHVVDFKYFKMYLRMCAYECMYLNTFLEMYPNRTLCWSTRGGGHLFQALMHCVSLCFMLALIYPNI